MKDLEALKRWLNKPENSTAKLAAELGYKTSTTINQWLLRESIPPYQRERVRSIIGKGIKK